MKEPWKKALYVIDILEKKGFEAFIVGGAVRDLLLCKTPVDIDITTSASLSDIKEILPKAKIIGKGNRKSACISIEGVTIDIVSFAHTTLEEDLKRRDFTINAMAMSRCGNIIDPWGGLLDLSARLIRFTESPENRVLEDPARIVRAARLTASMPGFTLAEETNNMCKKHGNLLKKIPPERIGKEILKAFDGKPFTFVDILENLDILNIVIPCLSALKAVNQDPVKHPEGDAFTHSLLCLKTMESLTFDKIMKIASLFHDLGKAVSISDHEAKGAKIARETFMRWSWPQNLTNEVCSLIEWHWAPFRLPETKTAAKLLLTKGSEWIGKLFLLGYADTLAGAGDMERYIRNRETILKILFNLSSGLPISGKDIINLYPALKGEKIGQILDELAEKIATSGPISKLEAIAWLNNKYNH